MTAAKPKLLVVDDEIDMLEFIARVFRRQYEVTRCRDAAQALEMLETGAYEVLITDQQMPILSGLELLKRLGDRHPSLVRVMLSGFTEDPELKVLGESCTVHNYILKPVDSRKLLDGLAEAYRVRDAKLAT
ncbi:response regulator [Haliangium ochraceum]|uniref:Response regulator receiver protein n=1 Tax=Haliangium ochraceum (strain DSM 14365 / JCM 11303 / SMP-2) TaxID=502025 RepID=D0LL50_HALO1|nr:response regulator [Haliangium ochraceum]ACY18546.1 response regulator receiver protein [Haliangium ochraceum DSM 14365]